MLGRCSNPLLLLLLLAVQVPAVSLPNRVGEPVAGKQEPAAPELGEAISAADREAWLERDDEARWLWHRAHVAPAAAGAWARFLAERGEYELLERLAIAGTRATEGALEALAEVDAPRWIRAAAWLTDDRDPATRERALASLRARAGKTLGWLAAFPAEHRGELERLATELEAAGALATEASAYLPPLDEHVVFGALDLGLPDAPVAVSALGAALRGEPGARYVHQVERAVEALLRRRARPLFAVERLALLAGHPAADLRQIAGAAHARLAPAEVALAPLLALVDAPATEPGAPPASEPAAPEIADSAGRTAPTLPTDVRASALAALAHARDARVFAALLDRVRDVEHPARVALALALVERDDGYLVQMLAAEPLGPLAPGELATTSVALGAVPEVAAAVAAQRARVDARDASAWAERVPLLLERAALADLDGKAFAAELAAWTLDRLTPLAAAEPVRAALRELAAADTPSPPAERDTAAVPASTDPLGMRVADLAYRALAE